MKSRYAPRILLPMLLLAAAFAGALWAAQSPGTRDAGNGPSGASTGLASSQKPDSGVPDTSQWPTASKGFEGVSVTYRHPAAWSADLTYCAPGADTQQPSGHLPARCASTDFLVGQKALDVGSIEGTPLTISGKSAVRRIVNSPSSVIVSQIYTVMVYDAGGAPIFGFSTQVGAGTDEATLATITGTLDAIAGTMQVEVSR